MARDEIRPLTGVRGVAALLVAVYHLNGPDAPARLRVGGLGGVMVAHGYLAVDLFFVLSGFVIALSYAEMLRGWQARNYVRFLIRRVARVYPLYLALTLGTAWLIATGLSHEVIADLPATLGYNLLMIQAWGFAPSLDGPAWSISTEWGAYLLFPLLAWLALFGRPRLAVATAAAAALCVVGMTFVTTGAVGRNGPLDIYGPGLSLARCLAEFTLGLIAFRLTGHAGLRRVVRGPWFAVAVTAAILAALSVHGSDLLLVALFPALVLALALGSGPVQRFFGCAPVFLAGELSYAIYLIHPRLMRVRDVLDGGLAAHLGGAAPAVASLVVYALLLVAAWVAFRWLERPARGFVRRAERLLPPSRVAGADGSAPLSGALTPP